MTEKANQAPERYTLKTRVLKPNFVQHLILTGVLSGASVAAPVTFSTQEPKPQAQQSRIVEVDGMRKILLPDGRVIPFGQSTQCTDICLTDEIAVTDTTPRRRWVVPVLIGAGIAMGAWIRTRGNDSPLLRLEEPGLPRTSPPPNTTIPEPMTLLLLGSGLAGLAVALRRRA